uniref:Autophagy-related protein 16 domain-containing protein n=1 Tax=Schistocephalus solidus TaxID=70667 RepID=A0A0X3NK16_SCHSO
MAVEPPWLSELLTNFHERDVHQNHGYDVVFRNYATILDRMLKLHDECAQLHKTNKLLQKENQTLAVKAELGNPVDSQDTRDKLFRLQEEVTELHREKGRLATDVITLTKTVQTKDQVVQKQAKSIVRLEEIVRDLQERNRICLSELSEVKNANQVLLDEQAATMLTVQSVESKNRLLEEDNAKLIRQIRILQREVEDLKNFESDVKLRLRREAVQRGLLDAAAAQVNIDGQTAEASSSFAVATVPSKAQAKVDLPEDVNCVRFSPSGLLFCSGGLDRKVSVWKVVNDRCELQAALVGCNAGVSAVDFNPHETMVLGASSDFACRVWTLSDNRLKINLTGHSERVLAARFMGDSNRVVTTSVDRTIKVNPSTFLFSR